MENKLPNGWDVEKLVKYAPIVKTGVSEYEGEKPYYSTGVVNDNFVSPEGNYTFSDKPDRANRLVLKDDVIQARMQGTKKALLIDQKLDGSLFSTGFLHFRPIESSYNTKLFYHYLSSDLFLKQRDEYASGSTQIALTDKGAKNIDLIIPPQDCQAKIANKLDSLLTKVKDAQSRLDKIPLILKRFRQSILASAFSGELTKDWRKERDLPKWLKKASGELFSFVTSGSRGWAKYYSESGVLFLRMGNLNHFSIKLDLAKKQYVDLPKNTEGVRTRVQSNDILISITADVGMIGVVPEGFEEAYINQHVSLARPKKDVNHFYLAWYLSSNEGQAQFQEAQRGATKVGLGLNDIKNVQVPLPSIEEQKEVVTCIKALFTRVDKIERNYKNAKKYTDKLEQSILAKAFRGELVS